MNRATALAARALLLGGMAACAAAGRARAQITLDFEGLPLNTAIPGGYGGIPSWNGFHAVGAQYGCAASGVACATNAFGLTVAIDRVERFRPVVPFGLISAYFTAWAERSPTGTSFNTPFAMAVRGYSGSRLVYSSLITVPAARTRIWFVWPNITSVVFAPQTNGWFLMDDLTYVNGSTIPPEAVVPEPMTLVLLGTGLAGLAGARRRQRGHRDSLSA